MLDYAKQAYILSLKWGEARHSSAASGTACQNKQVKKKRQGSHGGQQNGCHGQGQLMLHMFILKRLCPKQLAAAQSVSDLTGKDLCMKAPYILKKLVSNRLPRHRNVMPMI